MKTQSFIVVLAALAAMIMLPNSASAQHRYGTDRGARYYGGGGGGWSGGHSSHSNSFWNVSIGFGSGYHGNGFYGGAVSFGSGPYYRGGYSRYYAPAYYPNYSYCAPAPVYYAPRIVYAAPPVVYVPAPVYTSSFYYSSGGYYCR